MEHNEENANQNLQALFAKYFLESILKQQQNEPVDFSAKLTQQSSFFMQNQNNKLVRPFQNYSLVDSQLEQFHKHLININQQSQSINSRSDNFISNEKFDKPRETLSPKTRDDVYWERRRKNNEAAKRSRDARRAKEDEIALRASLLEQENIKLRIENAQLKQENIQLRCQIYRSNES